MDNPAVILYDQTGSVTPAIKNTTPLGTEYALLMRLVGTASVDVSSAVLPPDAATETTLSAIETLLGNRLPAALDADGGIKAHIQNIVNVLGPLTDTQLRASPVPVSGPLTDTQLRATPVPVSVSGPLNGDGEVKVDSAQLNEILQQLLTVTNGLAQVFNGQPNAQGRLRVHAEGVDNVNSLTFLGSTFSNNILGAPNSIPYDLSNSVGALQRQLIIVD